MKKFFVMFVALFVAVGANVCSAYDDYGYDPNYVLVTCAQGSIYLSVRSIDVQEYNPPHYQIAGYFVWTNGERENWFKVVIRYNWYTKETFSRDKYGNWEKSQIEPDCSVTIGNRRVADALFRAAYNMDFYGY